jgi:hypothetical protein
VVLVGVQPWWREDEVGSTVQAHLAVLLAPIGHAFGFL